MIGSTRIQQMSNSGEQQASRAKPVPATLAEYIDLANILPRPEDLPGAINGDIHDYYWRDEGHTEALVARYEKFRLYMKDVDLAAELPVQAVQRCKALGEIRSVLRNIARMDKDKMATQNILTGSNLEDAVTVLADPDGKCRVQHHPLLRALEGVELNRIRECPICGQIYWAGRIDKPCCTDRCARIRRTRKWREGYSDKYKLQRVSAG
jgi:hypothetical protein